MMRYLVNLRSQNEIRLSQPVDLVCPDLDGDPAPGQRDIRMMSLCFGDFPDAIYELEPLGEIREPILFLEVMLCHQNPAIKLLQQAAQFLPHKRRHAPATWDTLLIREFGHRDSSWLIRVDQRVRCSTATAVTAHGCGFVHGRVAR